VRVERVICAIDCGRIVNPDTVRAQAEGGAIFGITAALYGEITLKNGRVTQTNFDSCQMLRIDEAPAIEVYLVDSTEAPEGMSEPATACIASAVVNAVFAAKAPAEVADRRHPIEIGVERPQDLPRAAAASALELAAA
jgi:isoquinoline 1-oxidoreductase beta subunit